MRRNEKSSQEYLLSAAERDNLDCHCNPAQVVDFLSLVVAEKDWKKTAMHKLIRLMKFILLLDFREL